MKNQKNKILDWISHGSLAGKISKAIGILVIVCMCLMVMVSTLLSRAFLQDSIDGEFNRLADKNALIVQQVLDEAATTAQDIKSYTEDAYVEWGESGYNGVEKASSVYKVDLQEKCWEIENYILNTVWSTVANNKYIAGIGVFFEPDAFDPAVLEYTLYVGEEEAKNKTAQSYGAYSYYGSQEFYTEAASTKDTVFTKPYEDQGMMMVTASYPVLYKDEVQAVIVVDINIEQFASIDTDNSKYKSMFAQVLMADGTIVYDSESLDYTGQKMSDLIGSSEYAKIQKQIDKGTEFSIKTKKADGSSLVRYYTPIDAQNQTWWAVSALNQSDLNKNSNYLMVFMLVIAVVSIAVIIFITKKLITGYVKPIDNVVNASRQLKAGDFNIQVPVESDDEIGELAGAFSEAAAILRMIIEDLKTVLGEMANSNFNIRTKVDYPGEFDAIKMSIFALAEDITRTLTEINSVSNAVAVNADNISDGAQSLTEGATDQSSAVEELQATITNVSEEVGHNAEGAALANEKAKLVGDDITLTNTRMQDVVSAMNVINEAAVKINAIINSINDIASQTNLLALNASIEAARAGDAGRGFAVVATQVGQLATESASAAKDSTTLISDTLNAVEKGKKLVDDAAGKLIDSAAMTQELVVEIAQIAEASEQQANNLKELLLASEQISAVVEENTAMAEESSASSEELAAQAEKLKALIEVFKLYEK